MIKMICIIVITLFITACSDSDAPQKMEQDHIWKQQTDMINKAKGVEQLLNNAAIEQQQSIDRQLQQE
jgi:hypothetical protein